MKASLQCLSFFLVLSFLASCNGVGIQLDCNSNNSAFREAARDGDIEELERLISTGRVDINAHCEEHSTALMEVLSDSPARATEATARYLIEDAGVNITIPDRYGNPPLHMAANRGHIDTVRLLLRKGADVDSKNPRGVTPLMVTHDEEVAELLIEKGANVNHKDNSDRTPLHEAAHYSLALMSILIRNGADVYSKDNEGKTPLHYTCFRSSVGEYPTRAIVCLLENNSAINSQDNDGNTPLHLAAYQGSKKATATLLAWSADLNIQNNKGHKPLDPAHSKFSPEETFLAVAEAGCAALAEEILDNNRSVDINTKDENGDTALIIAARYDRITLVERLIARNANLNLKNIAGQTALMIAIEEGHEAVALALIAEKVRGRINLNLKDNKKWSALKYTRKGKGKNTQVENALLRNGAEEYLTSKKIKKGAKSLFFKTAKKAIETAPAVVAGA